MDVESIYLQMVKFTKENTKRIDFMDKVYTYGKMGIFMKANSRGGKWKAKEDGGLEMETSTWGSIIII
jgi:hypothetical protein